MTTAKSTSAKALKAPTMTPNEFLGRLDKLHAVICNGLWCHRAWETLFVYDAGKPVWSLVELNAVINRGRGFFGPVRFALITIALMEFAKAFDSDRKTASIRTLHDAAYANPSLVPYASQGDLKKVSDALRLSKKPLATLKKLQDQHLAHADAVPDSLSPLLKTEIDAITLHARSSYNLLSYAHRKTKASWQWSMKETAHHTATTFGVLIEDYKTGQASQAELIAKTRQ